MKFFVYSSRGYSSYTGMDQDTIIGLLTELGAIDIQFITEQDYLAALGS